MGTGVGPEANRKSCSVSFLPVRLIALVALAAHAATLFAPERHAEEHEQSTAQ